MRKYPFAHNCATIPTNTFAACTLSRRITETHEGGSRLCVRPPERHNHGDDMTFDALKELMQHQVCGVNEELSSFLHATTDRLLRLWKSSSSAAKFSVLLVFLDPCSPVSRGAELISALSKIHSPTPHVIVVSSNSCQRPSSFVNEALSDPNDLQRCIVVLPCCDGDDQCSNDIETFETFSAAIITMSAPLLAAAMERRQVDGVSRDFQRHIAILHSNHRYLQTVGGNLFCCKRDEGENHFGENDILSVHHLEG